MMLNTLKNIGNTIILVLATSCVVVIFSSSYGYLGGYKKEKKPNRSWQVCSGAESEREITRRKDTGRLEENGQSKTRTRSVEQKNYGESTYAGRLRRWWISEI
jgi:hypothetical protein